jgi:hypothetical protein
MQMTQTRAPQALPALLLGIGAVVSAFVLSALLGLLLGVGATMLGAMAFADTRSHGYTGQELGLVGAVLGVIAVGLYVVAAIA